MPRPNRGYYVDPKPNEHGIYEIKWTENGRSKRLSTGQRTFPAAQQYLAGFLTERAQQRGDAPFTVNQALDLYDRVHVAEKVIDKERQRDCFKPLRAFFGEMAIASIDKSHVRDYTRDRRTGKVRWQSPGGRDRGRKPVADATIRRELVTLIAAINCAATEKNPATGEKWVKADDIPSIPLPDHGEARDVWLEDWERDYLLRACFPGTAGSWREAMAKAERLPRIFKFTITAAETAARRKSIEKLDFFKIDRERLLIHFHKVDIHDGEAPVKKSKKRRVPVPISDLLFPIIERAYAERGNSPWLLDHPGSARRSFETVVEKAAKMLDAAGHKASATKMRNVTAHTLRHTWATRRAQDGIDMWKIAGVLGDDEATVRRNYAHHHPEYLREAVNGKRKERDDAAAK